MAEPENLDDEFFADLYDDNDAAPHGTHKPEATEEAMGDAPDLGGQDSTYTDTHDRNGNGNGESHDMMEEEGEEEEEEEEEEDDDDIDFNLGNTAAHVPTAGIASHQDSPAPSFSAPPQAAPPQQQFQNQPSHQNNHHHHQGHGKNSNSKEDGKMFIGGLNWETTDQSLRDYFSQFGEVLECTVMRDSSTGRSRGFGFLTFKDAKTVNVVMVKEHHLDGKIIDPKRAIPRDEQEKTSKIFVGGVSQETTDQEFKDYFTQFGRVVDATLMMDKDTGRPRGFGFVTFESDAGVDACLTTSLQIHGKPIEVKKAQPRGNMREEEETSRRGGKYGKNKFGGGSNGGGGGGGGGSDNGGGSEAAMVAGPNGNTNGMTPQAMAQMFQRVQQMVSMQQQFMMGRGGGQPMPAMPQMNPAMYQQMMQYQQMAMGRGGQGGGGPNSPMMPGMNGPMNPAMMQQMQQAMQQQMMAQGGGGNQGVGGQPQGAGGPNRPGYNAYEQQMFEQQKYERRHTRDQGGGSFGGSQAGGYGNQGWDGGMYEENMGGGGGGGGGSRGGGYRGGSRQDSQDPTNAPPANAPTGPKNAGKPGANFYRGGGRGGNRFHPYNR